MHGVRTVSGFLSYIHLFNMKIVQKKAKITQEKRNNAH